MIIYVFSIFSLVRNIFFLGVLAFYFVRLSEKSLLQQEKMKLSGSIVIEKKALNPSTSFILTGGQIGKGGTGLHNSDGSYIKERGKEKGGTLSTSGVIFNSVSKKQVSIIP